MFAARTLLALALLGPTIALAQQETGVSPQPTNPRCGQIFAQAPELLPLATVCEYAFSQTSLPNFVCDLSMQRFESPAGPKNWTLRDTVTAEVTFERGKGDRYAKVAIAGHPISGLTSPHTAGEIYNYLGPRRSRGWTWPADFGSDLLMVFLKDNDAHFKVAGEAANDDEGAPLAAFRFEIKRKGPFALHDLTPGLRSGDESITTGVKGLIWINKKNASLRRLVVHYTDIAPDFPGSTFAGSTDYRFVLIPELGTYLLPTAGERLSCMKDGWCARNISTFTNCHKYAAKSRVIPIH